jgi:hypothetical protein
MTRLFHDFIETQAARGPHHYIIKGACPMGKVRTNVAFKGFSNNIDGMVYYEREGKQCVRVPKKPANPNTPRQKKVRDAM